MNLLQLIGLAYSEGFKAGNPVQQAPVQNPVQQMPYQAPIQNPVQQMSYQAPVQNPVQQMPYQAPIQNPVQQMPYQAPVQNPQQGQEPPALPASIEQLLQGLEMPNNRTADDALIDLLCSQYGIDNTKKEVK